MLTGEEILITDIGQLKKIKEEYFHRIEPRLKAVEAKEERFPADIKRQIIVCSGSGCISCGCLPVAEELEKEVERARLTGRVDIIKTGCIGSCVAGPIVMVYPEGVLYQLVGLKDVRTIIDSHVKKGIPVSSLQWVKAKTKDRRIPLLKDIEYFKSQKKIVLANCGIIDPEKIEEYIARGGYLAAAKAISEMRPDEVISEVKMSKLRGRGGAGFPTGTKWEFAAKAKGDIKYVVCNADEGDPGAFMDRSVLEGDPHAVIEGMMICAYAIGAAKGYIYVRAEYPLAIERLASAIGQARERGILGDQVMGSAFGFDLEIRIGAGAFVCGEETALMQSIEGKRGEPRPRPPFPAVSGLWQRPTNINNVETFANITWIIKNGSSAYTKIGTEKSKGTKVFALAGDVVNTGLVEVPMGTTLREVIFDIGGGVLGKNRFKAAQLGGPSGGCIPAEYLDTPMDYESLTELGAMVGSGGLIVMDSKTCMVNIAKFFIEFVQDESCGKCPPCRVGTKRILEMLEKITSGRGEEGDIEKLEELCLNVKTTSLCGLGQTAANPVLSTIHYFRDEYETHIRDKICSTGVCSEMLLFQVDSDLCKKCGICLQACKYNAISWQKGLAAEINTEDCTQCRSCIEECPSNSIY